MNDLFFFIVVVDLDECENFDLNECNFNVFCINVKGFYICCCFRGYEGDGRFCEGVIIFLNVFIFLLLLLN